MRKNLKIIKPATLGILQKPFTLAGEHFLSVTALAFFPLGESRPRLLPEHEQWSKIEKALPQGQLLDEAMPKPRGEVLLAGHAYPAEGEAQTCVRVRLQAGEIDKSLEARGDRDWSLGWVPLVRHSRPRAFRKMPLDYRRAYGGGRYKKNPLGCGHLKPLLRLLGGDNCGPLPNLGYPGEKLDPGSRPQQPAGFGPLGQDWAQRRPLAGRYDSHWLKHHAPGYPLSLDPAFFNAAPQDQQLQSYWLGGENYRLENLHPSRPLLEGAIPEILPRAFAQLDGGPLREVPLQEVPLNLDTLWFFPDSELGVLIVHGQIPIGDSDGLDLRALLLAWEKPGRARSLGHYQTVLKLRSDLKTAARHAFNEGQLTPEAPAPLITQAGKSEPSPLLREIAQKTAATPQQLQQALDEQETLPQLDPAALESGNFDLGEILRDAEERAQRLQKEAERKREELQKQMEKLDQSGGQLLDGKQALERIFAPERELQQLRELADSIGDPAQRQQLLDAIPQLAQQQRAARRLASESQCQPVCDEASEALTGWLYGAMAESRSLAGLCLAGIKIHNADFRAMDLRDLILDGSELTDCRFDNSDLSGTSFIGAHLQNCSFDSTNLEATNWSRAQLQECSAERCALRDSNWHATRARHCNFSGCNFERALFVDSDLASNRFDTGHFLKTIFARCNLDTSHWRETRAKNAAWLECRLSGADFSGAELGSCAWLNTTANGVRLDKSQLREFLASGDCQLRGASLAECRAEQTGWRYSDLSGANFERARLSDSDLGMTNLDGASFRQALLHNCILMAASAQKADFTESNWMGSLARKLDLRGAGLERTRMYRADLSGALRGKVPAPEPTKEEAAS